MEWTSVKDRLPKQDKATSLLGYCRNKYEDGHLKWQGVIEVYFDPFTGWHRCEKYDYKPVTVLYWAELPQLPEV